jgi:DNA polymerase-2
MKGFIVCSDYEIKDEKTVIELYGRLENGESFVALKTIKPYFFIKKSELSRVKSQLKDFEVEETKLTTFNEEPVIKVSHDSITLLNKIAKEIHHEADLYESDVKPVFRFLIDNGINGTLNIEGDYQNSERVDRVYYEPDITPVKNFKPKLKIISLDIETDGTGKNLYCIGLSGENYEKCFIVSDKKLKNSVSCSSEEECLLKFKEELIKLDPDVITGWNVIDFDLSSIRNKFRKHKIPFDIGRNNRQIIIRSDESFFRQASVDIPGRQVLDALYLIKDPFIQEAPTIKRGAFGSYTLESVSQAILGEGKLIKGNKRHEAIEKYYHSALESEQQKLVDYNLKDCTLVYDLIEKTKMLDLAIERSQLTGLPIDRLTSSILAFDISYIRESRKKGYVSPSTHYSTKENKIMGGYVKSPESGIYENIIVLDFKSLYPSIIRTFNIDPASFLEKKQSGSIEAPNGAYFKNTEGVLPAIIENLHQARELAKKEKRELSSYAIKVIMNSFFGVLASPNCRYFNMTMANAITHFAQFIIKLTASEIEKKGYEVIYSDTDSVFIKTNCNTEKAEQLGKEIPKFINEFYNLYVYKNYNRKSFLEIQFAKLYLSLMFPKTRSEEASAKKRYAGLIVNKDGLEEIEITGLEAIRGDWTDAAADFQKELLTRVFHNAPLDSFIKEYVKKIKDGKMDSKLVYRKSIRKSLKEYTKTTPPHVKAARKLEVIESNIIEYYMTLDGPEPIQALKHKLDYEHYIDKQIKPIANQILSLTGKSFDDTTKGSKQTKLF